MEKTYKYNNQIIEVGKKFVYSDDEKGIVVGISVEPRIKFYIKNNEVLNDTLYVYMDNSFTVIAEDGRKIYPYVRIEKPNYEIINKD